VDGSLRHILWKYRTRADRAGETVAAIDKEIRRMAEMADQQELDEAKSYLKGSQMLALDTSSKAGVALLQYQLDKLPSITSRSATPLSTR